MTNMYEQIGGAPAVTTVVDDFYRRIMADTELAWFFAEVDLTRLKALQVEYFSMLLGGPAEYTGKPLRQAHRGLGITMTHFNRVAAHLAEALDAAGVPQHLIVLILSEIVRLADEIVAEGARAAQ
ncbi:group 1 truncated hemoglobin [Nocardia sp. NPDC051030]|uniref:group I truncated hemoglobin n=1 Tax=Nocardia sp. NPDC051030 TaxID=3155162 RepID=UPI00342396B1